jgi:hypothetical protein
VAKGVRVARLTKTGKNIPNGHKIHQMATKYIQWLQNIANDYKVSNIFNSKALKNLPNFGFFGLKIPMPAGNPEGS